MTIKFSDVAAVVTISENKREFDKGFTSGFMLSEIYVSPVARCHDKSGLRVITREASQSCDNSLRNIIGAIDYR